MKEVASEYHGLSIETDRIRLTEAIRMYLVLVITEMRGFFTLVLNQQVMFPTSS